jgi:L-ascorbate metabolism protein UlaG (beta-lactamase superfamily)
LLKKPEMKYTFYGHACFSVTFNGKILLFDPFITPNEQARVIDTAKIRADYIFLSHGHFDHVADVELLAGQTGAKLICNWEIYEWLQKKGINHVHPMNTGGKFQFDFGVVKTTIAQHSSGLPDGSYGGSPMGFVISDAANSFYYSGDTALTIDMQLIPKYTTLNFAILPIGDNFTMGVTDAIQAAKFLECDKIIGVHYNTFGYIVIDTVNAQERFSNEGLRLILPAIGETINI